MGVIDDILKALDRIPIWKRLQGIPDEVDALKARIEALEALVNGKTPGKVCDFCGDPKMRLQEQMGAREIWRCQACGKDRVVRPQPSTYSSSGSWNQARRGKGREPF